MLATCASVYIACTAKPLCKQLTKPHLRCGRQATLGASRRARELNLYASSSLNLHADRCSTLSTTTYASCTSPARVCGVILATFRGQLPATSTTAWWICRSLCICICYVYVYVYMCTYMHACIYMYIQMYGYPSDFSWPATCHLDDCMMDMQANLCGR